jgi:hypothetical protein
MDQLASSITTADDDLKWVGERHVGNQSGCARCGADEHLRLTYLPFTHFIDMGDSFVATHWAHCPTNGEPILLCQGPKAAPITDPPPAPPADSEVRG